MIVFDPNPAIEYYDLSAGSQTFLVCGKCNWIAPFSDIPPDELRQDEYVCYECGKLCDIIHLDHPIYIPFDRIIHNHSFDIINPTAEEHQYVMLGGLSENDIEYHLQSH